MCNDWKFTLPKDLIDGPEIDSGHKTKALRERERERERNVQIFIYFNFIIIIIAKAYCRAERFYRLRSLTDGEGPPPKVSGQVISLSDWEASDVHEE